MKWFSNDDGSVPDIGLTCVQVVEPPPGTNDREWAELWKLTRLIEGFPW